MSTNTEISDARPPTPDEVLPPAGRAAPAPGVVTAPIAEVPTAEAPVAPAPPRPMPKELGGPAGPEPTRFGDWERKGRVSDF